MTLSNQKRQAIIDALINELGVDMYLHKFSVDRFAKGQGISRQSVYRYLDTLIKNGDVQKNTTTSNGDIRNAYQIRNTSYKLCYPITGLAEDVVWNQDIRPIICDIPDQALRICNYTFSEMLNNAIDHSEGTRVEIDLIVNAFRISFRIWDDGVGLFSKIASAMSLAEKRFAVLELAKGKFTTAPEIHSGEGIFFSAKAADVFAIHSDDISFSTSVFDDSKKNHFCIKEDWAPGGTTVYFDVFCHSKKQLSDLFDLYTNAPDDYGFSKTVVPVRLLEHGDDNPSFMSRSQAKRLLVRFERFEHIELDFTGVEEIGQGFADEVFRVFCVQHPMVVISPVNCSSQVERMIKRVRSTK